jgi:transposase-like protein
MREEKRECPHCGATERQNSIGKTKAGSRRFRCQICRHDYTPEPKKWAYTEAEKKEAMRLLLLGNTGRAVGKALGMNKSNAYRWAIEAKKAEAEKAEAEQVRAEQVKASKGGLNPVDKSRDENRSV